ncbi:hypothetical protein GUJ93_ZPchr0009g1015 [Zizania palustris]|uniref:Uncharacterized protein n=1 Tax=Zizania palustris TaxID=103762 RepID=A0A8J5VN62_ZIZPA|nr:hypothetical protein GUJ93_ZPchr0009g1015 [Zizania palustris]
MEHRHIPYGFLHLQPLLRGLGDHLSDGQQKIEFLSALELHDKDVDDAIIKINEAYKDIEETQQKIVSEIKHMFGDLVGSSLNTESQRDVRRKRRAERPLGASSLNVKRKSQIPREVSPEHTDGGDDCPEQIILFENYTSESQYDENTVPSLLGEHLKAHDLLNASLESGTQYMDELMYYLFFHKMNEARGPSLELFELLAPGKTEHNVIEGTQQIIDLSDATKDGVASCDVEKVDVASRDEQEDVARTNL